MLVHWIWLATRTGLGDRGRMLLLQHFSGAEDVYFADEAAMAPFAAFSPEAQTSLRDKSLHAAEKILSDCKNADIHVLTWQDAAYPRRLKNIADPPVVLYYKGRLPEVDALPVISVVGTRKASAYGLTVSKRLGYELASCGAVVVSGMASGADTMAMRGALSAGEPVIGVLGCGADVVYPFSNHALYRDAQRQGCLLTEFPPGTPPIGSNFPRRNRIISGLACGVLVVEAPERSGALITAKQAADQGRDVFVVPGNIDVSTCKGSNALLRDGALAVSSGWDIVSEYEYLFPGKIRKNTASSRQSAYLDEVDQMVPPQDKPLPKVAQKPKTPKKKSVADSFERKKEIDKPLSTAYIDAEEKLPPLDEQEQKIIALIRKGFTLVDDLMAQSEVPSGQVLGILTMLEIKGVVTRLPGKRVAMKK